MQFNTISHLVQFGNKSAAYISHEHVHLNAESLTLVDCYLREDSFFDMIKV